MVNIHHPFLKKKILVFCLPATSSIFLLCLTTSQMQLPVMPYSSHGALPPEPFIFLLYELAALYVNYTAMVLSAPFTTSWESLHLSLGRILFFLDFMLSLSLFILLLYILIVWLISFTGNKYFFLMLVLVLHCLLTFRIAAGY